MTKFCRIFFLSGTVGAFVTTALPAFAQNPIQLFGSTYVRASSDGTSTNAPVIFNSATVNLTCAGGAPIKAVLSSTPDGSGNVLIDNFVQVSVATDAAKTGPTNVCRGGTSEAGRNGTQFNCFNSVYQSSAYNLIGKSTDPLVAQGGVAPIDVSDLLVVGPQQATIDLVDTGSLLANATLYLVTSCTQGGVTGPAKITGNPISSNPTPEELTQYFTFNPTPGQKIVFLYDLATSQKDGTLQITDGTIPIAEDQPLDPALWQSKYGGGTSFATSSCLVHTGELLNGQPACKLYTLTCQVGTGTKSVGALCPVSQLRDEVFADQFSGKTFTLPDITGPNGKTYHQGVGFLMASEGWKGGNCTFDPASGLQTQDCPQNLLTFFSTPGAQVTAAPAVKAFANSRLASFAEPFSLDEDMDIDGTGTHPNSSFISVTQVPEDLTTVTVQGQHTGGWVNSRDIKVGLSSEPPVLPNTVPNYQNFVASPIKSITYGVAPANVVLDTKFAVPGDVSLLNSNGCPTPANPGQPIASIFSPPSQTLTVPTDGQYLLHYFAQDCAGTEELKFNPVGNGGFITSFYTVPINVDTVAPMVATGPTLTPAPGTVNGVPNSYSVGQHVTATYSCSDNASGVAVCGDTTFSAPGTLNTGTLSSVLDTATPGIKTFTVHTTDIAGNVGTPVTVTYNVVSTYADLAIVQLPKPRVNTGARLAYDLLVVNFGPSTAQGVVIRDALPKGTTFISAGYEDFSCALYGGCNIPPQAGSCSFSDGNVVCNAGQLKPLSWSSITGIGIRIMVQVTAPAGSTLLNTAIVKSSDTDPNPGNNSSTIRTTVH